MQAEDELASIGMVIGAAWNGARAFTCTSGPGISLMTEFIGLAYFAEIPAVIVDVQRAGPSTGHADAHAAGRHPLLRLRLARRHQARAAASRGPEGGFEFTAHALDLADRLQTPVFVMTDLDIGMNERLCEPLAWDDARSYDRGKVMTDDDLEAGKHFGRYLDVDGDGITYRTYPGTHPKRGSFFTRGTSRDRYARYTEEGSAYVDNMQRLLRKFETAKHYVPEPVLRESPRTAALRRHLLRLDRRAMDEALAELEAEGMPIDALRVRAFPFQDEVIDFVNAHDHVFVVEQNRDGQLRTLLVDEGALDPSRLLAPVLHYDGTPITARFIRRAIEERLSAFNVRPLRRTAGRARRVSRT